ncbi:MAG: indole-3-glycerol phosphate synthase TrpC [Micropepsaceae bacterium]
MNVSTNVLAGISRYKVEEIRAAKAATPIGELEHRAKLAPVVRPFLERLRRDITSHRFGLIAEIKKASPSKGLIRADFNPALLACAYEAGSASCLSVLTDKPSFQGADAFLVEARAATTLPVLRKDFLYEPYQVVESRALGADCILIIMAAVSDQQAKELLATAQHWGMDVLVEVHNASEMERAVQLNPKMIGINNRDLTSFVTTLETTERLISLVPAGVLAVAESGINSYADVERLALVGVNAFLVGESLMRQHDVKQATLNLLGVKR